MANGVITGGVLALCGTAIGAVSAFFTTIFAQRHALKQQKKGKKLAQIERLLSLAHEIQSSCVVYRTDLVLDLTEGKRNISPPADTLLNEVKRITSLRVRECSEQANRLALAVTTLNLWVLDHAGKFLAQEGAELQELAPADEFERYLAPVADAVIELEQRCGEIAKGLN